MFRTALVIVVGLSLMSPTKAAVFFLRDGGTIEGELLNPDEVSRKTYRIRTAEKLEIVLDAKLVERVQKREREAVVEYNTSAPFAENTVESHIYWAKWCSEHQLLDQVKLHWQQVLELDPDNTDARLVLGYTKTPTGWVSRLEKLENRGLVQEQGRWKTRQQIDVEKILENQKKLVLDWQKKINALCSRLPNEQAQRELLTIRDVAAVEPLKKTISGERNPDKRIVLLRSLIRIADINAIRFVAGWSVNPDEPSEDVRQVCLDELKLRVNEYPEARRIMIDTYRLCLHPNKSVAIINAAANALGELEGYESVPALIEVLTLTQVTVRQVQQQEHSFGTGGTNFGTGTQTFTDTVNLQNQAVLTALRRLTGVNFQFDQSAWREWFKQTKRSPSFNLRRS